MVFFFVGLFSKISFFKLWRNFLKRLPLIFMGESLNYLKFIQLWQEELEILQIFYNNFEMVKSTKKTKIHKIQQLEAVFSIKIY